ncbi:membrane protein insertase YidC [Alphaproteobacteria bacterium]|nr:membrane protein insertase YidC [Alphaproteobacteria bacterium]
MAAPVTAESPAPESAAPDEEISLRTPEIVGRIDVGAARLDMLDLTRYRQTLDPSSPAISLLGSGYFMDTGYLADGSPLPVAWRLVGSAELTPETPVVAEGLAGGQLRIMRTYSVDSGYMLTIRDEIRSLDGTAREIAMYGRIARPAPPEEALASHQGFVGYLGGKLEEITYAKAQSGGARDWQMEGSGWFGFGDRFWLAAFVVDRPAQVRLVAGESSLTQADFRLRAQELAAGGSSAFSVRIFVGAKQAHILDAYRDTLGIPRFDLAIDYGWYYFLTKPFLALLSWLNGAVGNMGAAILILALVVRALLLPVSQKSYASMNRMRQIQPEMKRLQELYRSDPARLNQEVMALYRREKINPASGCLPMLLQIPVFFALYKVLVISIEMRQAPFFGWIKDLSAPDPTSVFTLFGLIPVEPPSFLQIGVWPLLMGITMYAQQSLSPPIADKTQARVFKCLPVIFTFMFAHFASGLVIYWAWSNLLGIVQQKYLTAKCKR